MSFLTLGRQPVPITGTKKIDRDDPAACDRAVSAEKTLRNLWVDYPPQRLIIARICHLLQTTRGVRGQPLDGLRLSQVSQAGKSKTLERCKAVLAQRRASVGLPPNPFELLVIGLDKRISLLGVYQEILLKLGDPYWNKGTEKVLRQRVKEFCDHFEVGAVAIDEIQHLRRDAGPITNVTDALKRMLDEGVVPLVLVGDMDSKPFFDNNIALTARLGMPLELDPLNVRSKQQAIDFKAFCRGYDEALVDSGIFPRRADLVHPTILAGLHTTSSGHIGRVARLIQHAAVNAAWRGAACIELFDLSEVVREYALPQWIDHDPFSEPRSS